MSNDRAALRIGAPEGKSTAGDRACYLCPGRRGQAAQDRRARGGRLSGLLFGCLARSDAWLHTRDNARCSANSKRCATRSGPWSAAEPLCSRFPCPESLRVTGVMHAQAAEEEMRRLVIRWDRLRAEVEAAEVSPWCRCSMSGANFACRLGLVSCNCLRLRMLHETPSALPQSHVTLSCTSRTARYRRLRRRVKLLQH